MPDHECFNQSIRWSGSLGNSILMMTLLGCQAKNHLISASNQSLLHYDQIHKITLPLPQFFELTKQGGFRPIKKCHSDSISSTHQQNDCRDGRFDPTQIAVTVSPLYPPS